MKKIIDGKLYDTEKAAVVARWSSHHGRGDFFYVEEALMKTEKGAYFVHGVGGPQTYLAKPDGNGYTGGEDIFVKTTGAAKKWLSEKQLIEEYETEFGPLEEA